MKMQVVLAEAAAIRHTQYISYRVVRTTAELMNKSPAQQR